MLTLSCNIIFNDIKKVAIEISKFWLIAMAAKNKTTLAESVIFSTFSNYSQALKARNLSC